MMLVWMIKNNIYITLYILGNCGVIFLKSNIKNKSNTYNIQKINYEENGQKYLPHCHF